jgi:hypothetical protein
MEKQSIPKSNYNTYTQRQWDRAVGYGRVPPEYQKDKEDENLEEIGGSNQRAPTSETELP